MLIQLNANCIINPDMIESIQETEVSNPDFIPTVAGIIEGNNQPPSFSKVIIRSSTGNEIILKNTTLSQIEEILRNSK